MVRLALVCVLLLAPSTLAAPVPKDFLKKPPKLDGKWMVTAYESNGRAVKTTTILNQVWAFEGENLTITRANAPKGIAPTKVKVRSDTKSNPHEFDYIFGTGSNRLGIFEIEGDTLTVCMTINTTSGERPANFDGGNGILKYVFKRVEK